MDIFIISTNRSDYGLLQPLIKKFNSSKEFKLTVIKIVDEKNYFLDNTINSYWNEEIIACSSSSNSSRTSITGLIEITISFSSFISKYVPKLIIVLGDRYELLPIVSQALLSKIPIAFAILSDPTCFLLTFIFNNLFKLICFNSLMSFILYFFFKKT